MAVSAGFQQSVNITPNGVPQYLAGDMIGNKNLYNPSQGNVVNINSSIPQAIGSFTWFVDSQTCTPLLADSPSGILLGFVARTQSTVWPYGNFLQGWNAQVAQGYQLIYFSTGTFGAICPSLNNAGAGPVLYNDIVLINNTTGALASQTSTTIPAGYTQVITGPNIAAWRVIDITSVYDAGGTLIPGLVAISNIQSSLSY
jgi:hypothetical protein